MCTDRTWIRIVATEIKQGHRMGDSGGISIRSFSSKTTGELRERPEEHGFPQLLKHRGVWPLTVSSL